MMLSGREIMRQQGRGLQITPFDEKNINPNSYNLTLHDELLVYKNHVLDMKSKLETERIVIPAEGLLLKPGVLYLGRTVEHTSCDKFVPQIAGRSSIGRLGLCIHVTAGFGDIGFKGYWTLELACVQPVKIYPKTKICQIYFHVIQGDYELYGSNAKYQASANITPSLIYKEF